MTKLFLYHRLSGYNDNRLVGILTTLDPVWGKLFQTVRPSEFKSYLNLVETVQDADFVFIPHDLSSLAKEVGYLKEVESFARECKKPILAFSNTDAAVTPTLENAVVLKACGYRSELRPGEYVVAAFVEDMGAQYGVTVRQKRKAIPVIGFTGMTKYGRWYQNFKYEVRTLLDTFKIMMGKSEAKRQGLFFRKKILKTLQRSKRVVLAAIRKDSYSANIKSIQGDVVTVRDQFAHLIIDSDLPLVVRGDGNYSLRFFEVLSLGRVPLFVDTDTALPFEDQIDYDSFMLRVSYTDIKRIPQIVENFWNSTTEEQFIAMQMKAREVFLSHLSPAKYYERIFEDIKKPS